MENGVNIIPNVPFNINNYLYNINNSMKIAFISDTHTKHKSLTKDLLPADIIIHCGDICSSGYSIYEVKDFLKWFSSLKQYKYKIFIAGNHDRMFENNPVQTQDLLNNYLDITYLENSGINIEGINIWGSPYQPEFCNWAFNKPRGEEIAKEWAKIPQNTDVLITHGPAYGYVDRIYERGEHLGCADLIRTINIIKPKIHACGHIHGGNGIIKNEHTIFINASNLNEQYYYTYKPEIIEI
jgi:Icc-related predicted phosphoesterase